MRAPSAWVLLVVALSTRLIGLAQSLEPVDKLAPVKYTEAAIVYPQPKGEQKFKYTKVPAFPGTKFYITYCGGPNVDREIRVSTARITYRQTRGPSGNPMTIDYVFGAALIKLNVIYMDPVTLREKSVVRSSLELSALWDDVSDYDVQFVNDANRKAAINALQVLIKYLSLFARKNRLAACMAYLPNATPEWANQPYNPAITKLTKFLKAQLNALKKVNASG